MKKYFIDKLESLKSKIDSLVKSIIDNATGLSDSGTVKSLVDNGTKLQAVRADFKAMQEDCMRYCSVDEVVEIASKKNYHGDETLNLIEYRNADYFYKYTSNGISISEREKLKNCFGRSFNEAKIK